MRDTNYEVESVKLFSESLIWQLNRDYYNDEGLDAWSKSVVPHNLTSNSMVGKTYAELILGFLKDLAAKGQTKERVYLLEMGAGHGRLAFHILKHLQRLEQLLDLDLPPYCYILSDIVEDNLTFFQNHPQFKTYFEQGVLDVAYFDAVKSEELLLRHSQKKIGAKDLNQPILAIANYFFDSLPNDLFFIQDEVISACSISLESKEDPAEMNAETLIKNLELIYSKAPLKKSFYPQPISNEILEDYKKLVFDTHLFFPQKGVQCLTNLQSLSKKGLMLLSMDKGFYEINDLEKKGEPEMIRHGSFSLWVNYHALGAFCHKQGGKVLFPEFSSFYLQMGCLLFMQDGETYTQTNAAYQRFVNDFGPDDFNSIKTLTYKQIAKLTMVELIALLRLSAYDSTLFERVLPRLKQLYRHMTVAERRRFAQTLHGVWNMYFSINSPFDLAYELGGIFYDLGYYQEALTFFDYSIKQFGQKEDIFYNQALCYYQLRQDDAFKEVVKMGNVFFPQSEMLKKLASLDLNAK